jgi:hypothetical protein
MGYAFVHTVIDDHSRVAYAETAATATAVLTRAVAWFADRGLTPARPARLSSVRSSRLRKERFQHGNPD